LYTWIIDTPAVWSSVAARLTKAGYKLFQTQYSVDNEEGLHVWFWAPDKPVVEFITHSGEVGAAMLRMDK
jgi:hypothetical protein